MIVRRQQRETTLVLRLRIQAQQTLRFLFVQVEQLPHRVHVGHLEVVDRVLQLVGEPHIAIAHLRRPLDVVHAVGHLQERRQPLQTVRQLGRNQIQVHPTTLLEVSELRDLETIQHHLPAHAPRAQCRRLPVVLFKFNIVLAQIDPDRLQAFQIQIDHILG